MKKIKKSIEIQKTQSRLVRFAVLAAAAVLFALPFNAPSAYIVGWISLSVLFFEIFDSRMTKKRVACSLFYFFFVFYFCTYIWFVSLYPLDFAGLDNVQSAAVVACALTLIPLIHSTLMTLPMFVSVVSVREIKSDVIKALAVSCAYTAGEFLQSIGSLAFPWARLFAGQMKCLELLQSASLLGSYFVTFVVVFTNALLAFGFLNFKNKNKRKSVAFVLAALAVFSLNFAYGRVKMADFYGKDTESINALVLQGNIPSGQKWDGSVSNTDVYIDLCYKAHEETQKNGFDVDFVLMPETALTLTLDTDVRRMTPNAKKADSLLKKAANELGADIFVGAFSNNEGQSSNSVFVYKQDGTVAEPYSKYSLVPFGEFLPYRNVFELLCPPLTEINMLSSDIVRGERGVPLEASFGKAAALVCFDSIFPENARLLVKNGAEIITVSTNDSWYKTSRALYQHADHSVMRAIENGKSVVRSANTGISLVCDPCGRVIAQSGVNERTYICSAVPLTEGITLYTHIGDVFAYACLVVTILAFVLFVCKKHLPFPRGESDK